MPKVARYLNKGAPLLYTWWSYCTPDVHVFCLSCFILKLSMYFFLIYFLLVFFCLSPHSFIMFTKSRFILVNLIISLPPCFYWYFIVRTFWSFLHRTWLMIFILESLFSNAFSFHLSKKFFLKESFSNMYCMTKKHEDMKGEGCSAHRPYI